jgi:hypothetical protein
MEDLKIPFMCWCFILLGLGFLGVAPLGLFVVWLKTRRNKP